MDSTGFIGLFRRRSRLAAPVACTTRNYRSDQGPSTTNQTDRASIRAALSTLPSLAVLIPTLNEEGGIRRVLADALEQADQVIVADGGSTDATVEVARELGALVVESPPGRGVQINRAAAAADSDILLVLHGDTRLPPTAGDAVRRAIQSGAEGGAFLIRFDSERWTMRFGTGFVNWRTRWFKLPLGDQAQFVRRTTFDRLGGFQDWPILEDLDFIRRLKRSARIAILPLAVTTDARRFVQNGWLRTVAINWAIWLRWSFGASPERLARWYYRRRGSEPK